MTTIDINCDMGEGFGPWKMGRDAEIMQYISSANIACGFHAGDPDVMLHTIRLAVSHGVSIGAHPGYPDLQGFGRRRIDYMAEEVVALVLYQLGALQALARSTGAEINHVKPHGALYNTAAQDQQLATAIATAVSQFSKSILLYCPPGSALEAASLAAGITVCREGFADRLYEPSGLLANRTIPGAVHRQEAAVQQAMSLAQGIAPVMGGKSIELKIDTLCIHGDTPDAVEIAAAIRMAYQAQGIDVKFPLYHAP